MNTKSIDLRPEPFELPFKHEQLDMLEENRQKLLKRKQVLGEGSIFAYCDSGTSRRNDEGETTPDGDLYAMAGYPTITKSLADAIQRAKDFVQYHERFADKRGGLNLDDCHEWGNARFFAEDRKHQPLLTYGIRLSFNDGTVLFFTIKSKPIEELQDMTAMAKKKFGSLDVELIDLGELKKLKEEDVQKMLEQAEHLRYKGPEEE